MASPSQHSFWNPNSLSRELQRFDGEVKLQSDAVKWGRPGTAGVTFLFVTGASQEKKDEGTREIQMFAFYI